MQLGTAPIAGNHAALRHFEETDKRRLAHIGLKLPSPVVPMLRLLQYIVLPDLPPIANGATPSLGCSR